ncbi:hypothetical protein N480_22255 [Pseudoalteromonas luteoviolacea S2607]|uniref:hypothetical protein n=1 Tax=Pseudoalteromonas luteoviolacea TaxID=43657 RepID=UPI0007B04E1F|nr:hypothetical protein [Pseudoalteromonas luteoviolacea]KZN34329.1 hypothetical protein N480_22255 [Pseudoalteromonas luteoviolacea S2607]
MAVGDYLAVWRGIYDLFYLGGEDFINYVFAAQLAINMKEFEHAVEIFRVAEEKYEVNLLTQGLTELDDEAEFVNSAAFKKWHGNSKFHSIDFKSHNVNSVELHRSTYKSIFYAYFFI